MTTGTPLAAPSQHRPDKKVILAASLGTVFEWYDFYLYGSLATILAHQFFGGLDRGSAFVFALLAFAAGFIVRPFGALVFGNLGDLIGRKYTFLVTIIVMGLATFMVGLLPNYDSIGLAAPVVLVGLRMLQGLALGGEYGGAATWVAEHAPQGRRGAYTSWIQATATLGLFLSLVVILAVRHAVGEAAFADWGWRLPFLGSILLLGLSIWIRLSMAESPLFRAMKDQGRTSAAPLAESFGRWKNVKIVALALFGLLAGQGVVWYAGQFYALFFLQNVLKVDAEAASLMVAAALLIASPFFVIFGTLSDRIGRKPVIMAGLLLACLTYLPMFEALTKAANPRLAAAQEGTSIVVAADPGTCSFQGNPVARDVDFRSGCDIAKRALAQSGASYTNLELSPGSATVVRIGHLELLPPTGRATAQGQRLDNPSVRAIAAFRTELTDALDQAGYPRQAPTIAFMDATWWRIVAILSVLVIYATMVYGPTAATLVELFPTRIRYTSMSLPYHIGNGWFGGLMPTIAFAMAAQQGNIYHGLWYPIAVAGGTLVVGLLFLRETKDRDLRHVD